MKFGQTNNEYISFSYDSVKLGDRTPLEMYRDFMIKFVQFTKQMHNDFENKLDILNEKTKLIEQENSNCLNCLYNFI